MAEKRAQVAGSLSGNAEHDLVHVAPAPVLARLDRSRDRVARFGGVPAGVLVRRGVAAADDPARLTQPQVNPAVAALQALGAAGDRLGGLEQLDLVQVRAGGHAPTLAPAERELVETEAAVDADRLAGDVRGLLGAQERDEVRDLRRLAHPP